MSDLQRSGVTDAGESAAAVYQAYYDRFMNQQVSQATIQQQSSMLSMQ